MRHAAYLVVLGLGFATAGCPPPEANDRLDRADLGEDGGRPAVSIGGGSGGTAGATGVSEGTGGGPTEWSTTTLDADIYEVTGLNTLPAYAADPIVNSEPHTGQVNVVAEGRDDETFVPVVAVDYDFRLDGVRKSDVTWVRVESEQSDFMSMLHQIDTADSQRDLVYVMRTLVMESILTELNTGLSYEAGKAQVVVRVIDDRRDGVEGVTVDLDGADDVFYLDGVNSWSGLADTTSDSGFALIVNAEARARDGRSVPIDLDKDGASASVSVPVYSDTVTLVELPAP